MKNVVLLNTSKIPPIQLLASIPDVRLSVVTEQRYSGLYPPGTTVAYVDDIERLDLVRDAVLRLSASNGIDYVVSASERTLQAGGYLRSLLGLPGVPYQTANATSNKYVMKRILAGAGIPVTRFRGLPSLAALPAVRDMRWPLVVKPILGTGAMDVFIIDSASDAQTFCTSPASARLRSSRIPLIVEEAVDADWEFHCEAVVHEGDVLFTAPGRYFKSLMHGFGHPNGTYLLSETCPDRPAVESLCRRAVRAVGLTEGVVHLEGFRTADGYLVGELASRPAGGAIVDLVLRQYGVDLWQVFVQASLAEAVELAPRRPDAVYGQWWFPPRPGLVLTITNERQLNAIPWVARAEVTATVGDRLGPPIHSSSFVATAIFRAEVAAQAVERARELTKRFELRIDSQSRVGTD